MTKKMTVEKATEIMNKGYHCSQSVMCHIADDLGMIDKEQAMKISSGLGGGCYHGDVCGTISAGALALGLAYGYAEPDPEKDGILISKVQELEKRFIERNGGLLCKELLGVNVFELSPEEQAARMSHDSDKSVGDCPKYVADVCEIVDDLLKDQLNK